MTSRARIVLATLPLLLLCLGCMCGDEGEPPTRADCDSADPSAMVDSIELDAFEASGGQGLQMIMLEVTYRGAALPSCAAISYVITNSGTGETRGSGSANIETVMVDGGVRTREPHWEIWDFGDEVDVTVDSYGQTATAHVCRYADCGDAGL